MPLLMQRLHEATYAVYEARCLILLMILSILAKRPQQKVQNIESESLSCHFFYITNLLFIHRQGDREFLPLLSLSIIERL